MIFRTIFAGGLTNKGTHADINADDIKTNGVYHLNTGSTPEYVYLIVIKSIEDRVIQFLVDVRSPIKTRVFMKGSWTEWV